MRRGRSRPLGSRLDPPIGNLGNLRSLARDSSRSVASSSRVRSRAIQRPHRFCRPLESPVQGAPAVSSEWSYWDATRIIPPAEGEVGPINEFPAFTFLYADLRPYDGAASTQAALGAIAGGRLAPSRKRLGSARRARRNPVVRATSRPRAALRSRLVELLLVPASSILLAGLVGGALRATNTWDYPTIWPLMATGWLIGLSASQLRPEEQRAHREHACAFGAGDAPALAGMCRTLFRPIRRTTAAPMPHSRYGMVAEAPSQSTCGCTCSSCFRSPPAPWLL